MDKRRLLAERLAQRIVTERREPMSHAQRRLWLFEQANPGSVAYNMPSAVQMNGFLDVAALERVLEALVRRHETLRTVFSSAEETQVIRAQGSFPLRHLDLTALPKNEREAAARKALTEEAWQPFDLECGPVARALLIRLEPERHHLQIVIHHIASDGWSLGVLMTEMAALYAAFCHNRPSPLPPLPIQYANFARWQREYLSGERLDTMLTYWQRQLHGATPVVLPPADSNYGGGGQAIPLTISAATTVRLEEMAQHHGATLFMVLLAGFAALLGGHTGCDNLVIGTPVANRTRQETEGLIGFFTNILALRLDLSGNPVASELLGRVQRTALEAYQHQDAPFDMVLEALSPQGNAALVNVIFALQGMPVDDAVFPGLSVSSIRPEGMTVRFGLEFHLWRDAGGLSGFLAFDHSHYDAAFLHGLCSRFETTLSWLTGPSSVLSQAPMLEQAERARILGPWRGSAGVMTWPSLDQLVAARVDEQPDAVAVEAAGRVWTYGELWQASGQVAAGLQARGVKAGDRIAVRLERGAEFVLAVLGIVRAGAAYVPIDPAYPAARAAHMRNSAGIVLMIAQTGDDDDILTVVLNDLTASPALAPTEAAGDGGRLAYVMFTSGSTGLPKGVAVPHGAVARLVQNTDYISFVPGDRIGFASNTSFDAATLEIWGALTCGATLVLLERDILVSPAHLADALVVRRITTLFLTTSVFSQTAIAIPSAFQSLNHVLFGGEVVAPATVRAVLAAGKPRRLANVYGPTENTTFSTSFTIDSLAPHAFYVPIGGPIGHSTVCVLDRWLRPVPPGAVGELYVGGDGLAWGYWGRPALTAERFVPDPFSDQPGTRLYRTGDLVRWRGEGNIEYVGRRDRQVKLRGLRIEPEEIEAVLRTQTGVASTSVQVRTSADGEQRLVAYWSPKAESQPTNAQLRAALSAALPAYMVPAAFVQMPVLPLTPNGKIDTAALPEPQGEESSVTVAPRDEAEALVAGLMADLLGRERVSVTDSFFDLGGHSLQATRLITRIRQTFNIELPLRTLFESPTPAGLAAALHANDGSGILPPLVAIEHDDTVALSFAQQRLWVLDRLQGPNATYNMAGALRLNGPLNSAALQTALNSIVSRHQVLRTRYVEIDGGPMQIIAAAASVPLLVEPVTTLSEAQNLAEAEAMLPFDLATGPMLRTRLLQIADDDHVLLITLHHIAGDGVSVGVLMHEMGAHYTAVCQGGNPLPPLPVQYADYALWQRAWLDAGELERQSAWWSLRLQGAPPVLILPTDRPRPAVARNHGATLPLHLKAGLSTALEKLARDEGATTFMVMLAAWAAFLGRLSGQNMVVIGSPVANRRDAALDGLIGFFVNTLALPVTVPASTSFRDLLRHVRETTLGALAHQDVPFERLVEALAVERSRAHAPLFQTMLAFQSVVGSGPSLNLDGLTATALSVAAPIAKFDLTLTLIPGADGLSGSLEYDTDLFDGTTITRWATAFQFLLEGFVDNPEQPLARLKLLDSAPRQEMLRLGIAPKAAEQAMPVHRRIQAHAAAHPAALAVACGNDSLDYGELNTRANCLAHALLAQGIGPEIRVALCLDRSVEVVVAMLAVLKIGAAAVPLVPQLPSERQFYILTDSAARVVLTTSALAATLPIGGMDVIALDTLQWQDWPQHDLHTDPPAQALAYLIYTSGSTGQPKPVGISHASLASHLGTAAEAYGYTTKDSFLAAASLAFDLAQEQLLAPLIAGGTVIMTDHGLPSGRVILDLVQRHSVTVLNLPPALWTMLISEAIQSEEHPPSLRLVIVGADSLPGPAVAAWRSHFGDSVRLLNAYGPTETTITATLHEVSQADAEAAIAPIGKPMPGRRAYVLDQTLEPVPRGITGELYLGGAGLARGYMGRPALTASCFVPDPFSDQPGGRMYRTGDLARWRDDGILDFLGRDDQQVKIRGFRVELGEIEAVLTAHVGVHQAAVIARGEDPLNPRLVAYIVATPGGPTTAELHAHLTNVLPNHMVPADFVLLDELPLNVNGKLDRARLPAPQRNVAKSTAPRIAMEWQMLRLWQSMLNHDDLGITDDFFSAGGNSLTAIRLMMRVRQAFGIDLPLSALFEAPTVERLTARLRDHEAAPPVRLVVPLQPDGMQIPLFCVHPMGGSSLCFIDLARALGSDQPVYGLQPRGFEDDRPPIHRLEDMAAAYVEEIRMVQPTGPSQLAGWSLGGIIAFEMARQLAAMGERINLLAVLDSVPAGFLSEVLSLPQAVENDDVIFAADMFQITPPPTGESDRLGVLLAEAHQTGQLPQWLNRAGFTRLIKCMRASQLAYLSYEPKDYDGQLLLIKASDNSLWRDRDPSAAWSPFTNLETVAIACSHNDLLRAPHDTELASLLSQRLATTPATGN